MTHILNIETATTNCSVSLARNGETLVLKEDYNSDYSHAERLHLYIDKTLKEAGLNPSELDAVAVSKGPGSYTGLRIGVSAAKGLAFALGKPLISIATLESLALQVKTVEGVIIPMLDARRMEAYTAVFNSDHRVIRETRAEILSEASYTEFLANGEVTFIGSAVEKLRPLINHPNAFFIEEKLPSADQMSSLAYSKFMKNEFEDTAYFEPFYLKDFIVLHPKS